VAVAIACPSCDKLPPATAAVGAPCPACGTPLVAVDAPADFGAGLDLPDVTKPDDAAFAPPKQAEPVLELDAAWVAERAAKQAAARAPPRRASRAGIIVAVVLIIAATIAVIQIVRHDSKPAKSQQR
jgi:hypothetical protein